VAGAAGVPGVRELYLTAVPQDKAYSAWPERIYVIAPGGRIEYRAEPGPFGFEPDQAEKVLKRLLASP
jgi:Iodothyronine deiodinase